jgi:hypothetical protein
MNGPRRHTPDLLGAGGYGNGPSDFMFFGKIGEDKRGEDSLSLRVQRRSRVARLALLAPENKEPCNDDDCRATECEGIRDISEH